MDVSITDKSTGRALGSITEEDLQFLTDQLEEESSQDVDYFIDTQTILMLELNGGRPGLIATLRAAVGSTDGIEIVWAK